MRETKVPGTGPKKKLLDAAVKLVLEKSYDSVSVRDITGAIKANVASINYHFGNRENLLDLVMLYVLEPLCTERTKSLATAEHQRAGKRISIEEILRSYLESTLVAAGSANNLNYLKLVGKTLVLPRKQTSPMILELRNNVAEQYLTALAKASQSASEKELAAQWNFFDAALNQSLQTITAEENISQTLETWLQFGIRGFSKKAHKEPKKQELQGQLFDF